MPFKKGQSGNPAGRKVGTTPVKTQLAREAIAQLVDGNAHRLNGWLDEIAKHPDHGPLQAWKCMMDVIEYHIPKLQRTDVNLTGNVQLGGIRQDDQEGPV